MKRKKLSVIFPIYNEETTIKKTLIEWKNELNKLSINYEIIIAEDGSTDGTRKILIKLLKKYKNKFKSNIRNKKRGYADAIRSSVKIAKGKYILSVDSDGQCDPKDFRKFWNKRNFLNYNEIVIGHRFKRSDTTQRLIMSKFFLLLHRLLFFSDVKDPSCPYIFCESKFFKKINPFLKFMVEGFWWGFTAICIKKNIKIHQIKINHRKRLSGYTNVFHFNRIPTIAFRNIIGLIKIRLINIIY
tara:strand:+ start:63 stop:791 length:729 start_codon:yes stop_codon:yes gene_type:complete